MTEGGKKILNPSLKTIKPLITIITVVKNGEKHLEECIKSVLAQKFQNFEYVILDGGSTDNSQNNKKI